MSVSWIALTNLPSQVLLICVAISVGFNRIQRGCMTAGKYLFMAKSVIDSSKMEPRLPMKKCLMTDSSQLLCVCRHKTKCNKRWMYHLLEMITAADKHRIIQSAAAADHKACEILPTQPEIHSTKSTDNNISPLIEPTQQLISAVIVDTSTTVPTHDEAVGTDHIIQTVSTTSGCTQNTPDPIRLLNPVPKPHTTTVETTESTEETAETPKFRPAPGVYALRKSQMPPTNHSEISPSTEDTETATEPLIIIIDDLVNQLENAGLTTTISTVPSDSDELVEELEELPVWKTTTPTTLEYREIDGDSFDENIPEKVELEVVRIEVPPEPVATTTIEETTEIEVTTSPPKQMIFPAKNKAISLWNHSTIHWIVAYLICSIIIN